MHFLFILQHLQCLLVLFNLKILHWARRLAKQHLQLQLNRQNLRFIMANLAVYDPHRLYKAHVEYVGLYESMRESTHKMTMLKQKKVMKRACCDRVPCPVPAAWTEQYDDAEWDLEGLQYEDSMLLKRALMILCGCLQQGHSRLLDEHGALKLGVDLVRMTFKELENSCTPPNNIMGTH